MLIASNSTAIVAKYDHGADHDPRDRGCAKKKEPHQERSTAEPQPHAARKHPTCNHLNMEARTFEFARHPKTGGGKTKAPRDESARNLVRNPKGANMATASVR